LVRKCLLVGFCSEPEKWQLGDCSAPDVPQDLSSNVTCPKQQFGHSDAYLTG